VVASISTWGLGSARVSAAGAEPVALIWNAPAGCPTSTAIQDEVDRSLAGSLKEVAPVAAAVNVLAPSPPGGRWRATLALDSHGKRAERQFEAESCEALAAAAALIIALAAEGDDDSSPTRPPPLRPADKGIDPTLSAGPAEPGAAWNDAGVFVLVGALLDSGTMPDEPAVGLEIAAEQSWTASLWHLRLIIGSSLFLPQNLGPTMNAGDPSGRYWMASVSGRGCLTAALFRFEVGPCLGGEVAVMHATDIGGTLANSTQYWASPLGSAMAAVTVTARVVLFARTDIVVPTTRRTFLGTGNIETYTIPSFAVRGAVGVELRLF
jgi:hypothetical protein